MGNFPTQAQLRWLLDLFIRNHLPDDRERNILCNIFHICKKPQDSWDRGILGREQKPCSVLYWREGSQKMETIGFMRMPPLPGRCRSLHCWTGSKAKGANVQVAIESNLLWHCPKKVSLVLYWNSHIEQAFYRLTFCFDHSVEFWVNPDPPF